MKMDLGPSADLSIDKETSTGTVTAGGLLTYTLSVRNQGPATATNVQVRGFLPAGTRLVSISAENSDFGYEMCLGDASCNLGTVYGTTVAQVRVVLALDAEYEGTSLTNLARVAGDQATADCSIVARQPRFRIYLPLVVVEAVWP